jgi:hypothetical protein
MDVVSTEAFVVRYKFVAPGTDEGLAAGGAEINSRELAR